MPVVVCACVHSCTCVVATLPPRIVIFKLVDVDVRYVVVLRAEKKFSNFNFNVLNFPLQLLDPLNFKRLATPSLYTLNEKACDLQL
jgi:hypothetical protein